MLSGLGRSPGPDSTPWTPGGTNEIDARAAAALKAGREALGLTQREAAARAGLSRAMIAQLETGVKGFTTGTLIKVAAVLEVDPSDLIMPGRSGGTAPPPDRPSAARAPLRVTELPES
jgi:transcriptional regulator with XRE-family HTH domain